MTDESALPDGLARLQEALKRRAVIGRQLVGLRVHDVTNLAARHGYVLRLVSRDGKALVVTADLHPNRIDVNVEGDIVVGCSGAGPDDQRPRA